MCKVVYWKIVEKFVFASYMMAPDSMVLHCGFEHERMVVGVLLGEVEFDKTLEIIIPKIMKYVEIESFIGSKTGTIL